MSEISHVQDQYVVTCRRNFIVQAKEGVGLQQPDLPSVRTLELVERLSAEPDVVGSNPVRVVPHQDRLQLLLLHVREPGLV